MRNPLIVLLVASLLMGSSSVYAKSEAEKEEAKREDYRKKITEKMKELNGTSWDVQIKSADGKGILTGADTLTFQDQKVSSKKASKEGWNSTNYTLTVQEEGEGPTVWETMQSSEKAGVAFWRGEWKDDVMTGVISHQLEDKNEEYTFTSSAMTKISPTSEKTEEAATPSETVASSEVLSTEAVPAQAPAEEKKPEEPKKKTSWFF